MTKPVTPTTIATVVVGSRLHGSAGPESDTDTRSVIISPLADMVSPIGGPVGSRSGPDDSGADHVTFELRLLLKHALSCNPTALEIIWSRSYVTPPERAWSRVRELRPFLLDNDRLFDAHDGMRKSLIRRVVDHAVKASDADTEEDRRDAAKKAGKAAHHAIRAAYVGASLLTNGSFQPDGDFPARDLSLGWKKNGLSYPDDLRVFFDANDRAERALLVARRDAPDRVQDVERVISVCGDLYYGAEIARRMAGVVWGDITFKMIGDNDDGRTAEP